MSHICTMLLGLPSAAWAPKIWQLHCTAWRHQQAAPAKSMGRQSSGPNPMCLQVLERVCRDVQQQAALYQESVRDESELGDTTGVELGQVGCSLGSIVCGIRSSGFTSQHAASSLGYKGQGLCFIVGAGGFYTSAGWHCIARLPACLEHASHAITEQ